jgi:hypothetical protein
MTVIHLQSTDHSLQTLFTYHLILVRWVDSSHYRKVYNHLSETLNCPNIKYHCYNNNFWAFCFINAYAVSIFDCHHSIAILTSQLTVLGRNTILIKFQFSIKTPTVPVQNRINSKLNGYIIFLVRNKFQITHWFYLAINLSMKLRLVFDYVARASR